MDYSTKLADYDNAQDAEAIVSLMREYARIEKCDRDEFDQLPRLLSEIDNGFTVLAYADSKDARAVGMITCFFGFSTFQLKTLVNIHDVIVTKDQRGNGLAGLMLDRVELESRSHGACRLTLEVLGDNQPAITAYEKFGFNKDPSHPNVDTYFLRKSLGA